MFLLQNKFGVNLVGQMWGGVRIPKGVFCGHILDKSVVMQNIMAKTLHVLSHIGKFSWVIVFSNLLGAGELCSQS